MPEVRRAPEQLRRGQSRNQHLSMINLSKFHCQRSAFQVWRACPSLGILQALVIVALAGFLTIGLIAEALHASMPVGNVRRSNSSNREIWNANPLAAPLPKQFSGELGVILPYVAASLLIVALSALWARRAQRRQPSIRTAHGRSHAFAEATLLSTADAIVTIGPTHCIETLNPAAEQLLGLPSQLCVGMSINGVRNLIDTSTGVPVELLASLSNSGNHTCTRDLDLIRTHGPTVAVRASLSKMGNAAGHCVGYVMILRDMTREHELIETLAWQASHDALTGLINRSEFERCLGEALVERVDGVLMVLDLDGFKDVNDACGHAAGDALLRDAAAVFRSCLDDDDVLGRLGGDEFGIFLPPSRNGAPDGGKAERIRACIESFPFQWEGEPLRISVSIGVLHLICRPKSVEKAMRIVDVACYAAKAGGRNRVHVADSRDMHSSRPAYRMQCNRHVTTVLENHASQLHTQRIVPNETEHDSRAHAENPLRVPDIDGNQTACGTSRRRSESA